MTYNRYKKYYEKNKERINKRNREWREKNKERVKKYKKEYREKNKDKIRKYNKKLYAENKEEVRSKVKEYYKRNREKRLEYARRYSNKPEVKERRKKYNKEWSRKNKERVNKRNREWRKRNRDKVKKSFDGWKKKYPEKSKMILRGANEKWKEKNPKRYRKLATERTKRYHQKHKEEPKYHLDGSMGRAIYRSLKGKKAGCRWEALVDYTLRELMDHLEKQFDDEMSWDNYGIYWHIDHIKPRSLFQYSSPEDPEFKECWALKNLQPLEGKENIRKSNKYVQEY